MIEVSKEKYAEFIRAIEIVDKLVELSESNDVIITSLNSNIELRKESLIPASGQIDSIITGYKTKARIGDVLVSEKSFYLTGKSLRSVLQIK